MKCPSGRVASGLDYGSHIPGLNHGGGRIKVMAVWSFIAELNNVARDVKIPNHHVSR